MSNPITDLVNLYFPAVGDISEADVLSARGRLQAWLAEGWPELDTRANSVYGDLQLTPAAYKLAAAEIALGRFMSDLNLSNVANGTIYNCAFVTEYLKNFAIFEETTLQASGYIRLTFSQDAELALDRGVKFKFGSDVFYMRLPHPGALLIRPVGSPVVAGTNTFVLSELQAGSYAISVPVYGAMTTAVLAGDAGTISELPSTLTEIVALAPFNSGLPPESLATLAARTRQTFYAASLTSRGSASRFVQKEYPDVVSVSPVLPGDSEMLRASANALGISQGKVDLYARSSSPYVSLSQTVRLPYYLTQNAASLRKFIGKLQLLLPPAFIDSITYGSGDAAISFPLDSTHNILFSRSTSPSAPMASAAYTSFEELWLCLDMPVDEELADLIIPNINDDGQYIDVTVVYRADPMLPALTQLLSSRDVRPANSEILVRGYVIMVLDSLTIQYTRKRGTTFNADAARSEILSLFANFAYPDVLSESKIYDAMYYAGAQDVRAITCQAHVQWSSAQRFLPSSAPLPSVNYTGALAASKAAREITTNTSKGLTPTYSDEQIGTADATYETVGLRNICYLLDTDKLVFTETIV